MTPATAAAPKLERSERPERVRFMAPIASGGTPLKITLKRQREYFDQESGKKQVDPTTGRYVHFVDEGNGVQAFETDDPDLIQILRVRANTHGTYVEVPIQKPSPEAVLSQIIDLVFEKDVDALVELYREEDATHRRPEVFTALEKAVATIS